MVSGTGSVVYFGVFALGKIDVLLLGGFVLLRSRPNLRLLAMGEVGVV